MRLLQSGANAASSTAASTPSDGLRNLLHAGQCVAALFRKILDAVTARSAPIGAVKEFRVFARDVGEWSFCVCQQNWSAIDVLVTAALAWLVATLAMAEATDVSMAVIVPLTLLFGLLVGRGRAGRSQAARRAAGRVSSGAAPSRLPSAAVVGELAAVAIFSGPIDRVLDERAARSADATPAIAQASAELNRTRAARTALDAAVDDAGRQRDEALVVARCEFHPSPMCPQTHITGVPGAGPGNTHGDGLSRRHPATSRRRCCQPRPIGARTRRRDRRGWAVAGAGAHHRDAAMSTTALARGGWR